MSQYRDYEAQQQSLQRPKPNDPIQCKTCKCEWFEQIRVSKFDALLVAGPGQTVPELGYSHVLLRCAKCNDLQELPINLSSAGNNPMVGSYTEMAEALQENLDEQSKTKPVPG